MRDLGIFTPGRPYRTNAALLGMLLNGLHDHRESRVFVVQVGAGTGSGTPTLLPRFAEDGWSGLLIEPHPGSFSELERLHADSDRVAVLNLGISDIAATHMLHSLSAEGAARHPKLPPRRASILRDRIAVAGVTDSELDSVEVPFLRLDSVLDELGIDRVDLIVVNAGGHELQVMRSFDAAACDASLLLVQSQVDTPLDADLVSHLHAANYAPFRIGSWLIGLRPGRLQVPLDELLHFFRRGVDQTDADE